MTQEIEVSPHGGKHSRLGVRCDLLPPRAILDVARILATGANNYGIDNWRLISQDAHINHALAHLMEYQIYGNRQDLINATCRLMFALETNRETESERRCPHWDVLLVREETQSAT